MSLTKGSKRHQRLRRQVLGARENTGCIGKCQRRGSEDVSLMLKE